jgi:iron uptake system component EfeO
VPAATTPTRFLLTGIAATLVLGLAACGSSQSRATGDRSARSPRSAAVSVSLTPAGCAPKPASISAGTVDFTVANKNADAVSEAELRTSDMTKILGEQENLTPGLSGGFSLSLQPGRYKITCPGAATSQSTLTVTGQATGASWHSVLGLASAVTGYASFVTAETAALVTHTRTFCEAIEAGQLTRAQQLYPKARVYYERIEPVAEIWGSLDTKIDGRWENPVTVRSQFTGFHRLEQLLWQDKTLTGAPALCTGLVQHERQLLTLVRSASYNPLELAAGATDLINEAATSKITGEEERYSNTDLVVFEANVQGAMKVVTLLQPYLSAHAPSVAALIRRRAAAVNTELTTFAAAPGYDKTGFVDYSAVTKAQRRQLSAATNALAEALSQLSAEVS